MDEPIDQSGVTAAPAGAASEGQRPPPTVGSLSGVVAGLLLTGSLFWYLGSVGEDNRRMIGLGISLAFELGGLALLLLHRSKRARTAAITLITIGVIPVLVFLFVDVDEPSNTVDSVSDFTRTATIILSAAAAFWLAAYFLGPSRRYGILLGAGLVALWLVAVVQILDRPISQIFEDPLGTLFYYGDDDRDDDYTYTPPDNPAAKLGISSLIFGGAYLAVAAWRDRRRDHRQATALYAAAAPILTLATLFLGDPLRAEGASVLGLALGVVVLWLGTRTGRRFTSWYGALAIAGTTALLVWLLFEDSASANAVILLGLGLAIALAAGELGGRSEVPAVTSPAPPPPLTPPPSAMTAVPPPQPPWVPPEAPR